MTHLVKALSAACLVWMVTVTSVCATESLRITARSFHPGEVILAELESKAPIKSVSGTFFDQELHFIATDSGKWIALAGVDLDVPIGKTKLTAKAIHSDGATVDVDREIEILQKDFPTKHLRVPSGYVDISAKDLLRIEKEQKKLDDLFLKFNPERLFNGNFSSPLPGAPSARFGERRFFNGEPRRPHGGADLKAKNRKKIRAPQEGKVVLVADQFFLGKTLVLDHGLGVYSYYGHLSKILVKENEVVTKDQEIAEVGATGRATGPHLHWGIKVNGARVDPFSLVSIDFEPWLKQKNQK